MASHPSTSSQRDNSSVTMVEPSSYNERHQEGSSYNSERHQEGVVYLLKEEQQSYSDDDNREILMIDDHDRTSH